VQGDVLLPLDALTQYVQQLVLLCAQKAGRGVMGGGEAVRTSEGRGKRTHERCTLYLLSGKVVHPSVVQILRVRRFLHPPPKERRQHKYVIIELIIIIIIIIKKRQPKMVLPLP
jgi:hypothetical protein